MFQEEWTPLHITCYQGPIEVISILLKAGADIEARDQVIPLLSTPLQSVLNHPQERADSTSPCLLLWSVGCNFILV
jgi:ankyrin repeat protein